MADSVFTVNYVHHGYCAMAQRIAVLWPLMGHRALSDREVGLDLERLVKLWRTRLSQFRELGWESVQNIEEFQYMRNCSPQMAAMKDQTGKHSCKRRLVCPWCYARRVSDVYQKFAHFLPEEGEASFNLLAVKNTHLVPERHVLPGQLHLFLFLRSKTPAKVVRRLQCKGSVYHTVVNPYTHSEDRGWAITYRVLAIVNQDFEVPDWIDPHHTKMVLIRNVTRKRLAGAVGKVMRYPVGLLRSNPELAVQALDAQSRRYLCCPTGCLRGNIP